MKNFQVRLSDNLHRELGEVARSREASIADIVREALEVHLAGLVLLRQGGRLLHERPDGGQAEVFIPGALRQ